MSYVAPSDIAVPPRAKADIGRVAAAIGIFAQSILAFPQPSRIAGTVVRKFGTYLNVLATGRTAARSAAEGRQSGSQVQAREMAREMAGARRSITGEQSGQNGAALALACFNDRQNGLIARNVGERVTSHVNAQNYKGPKS